MQESFNGIATLPVAAADDDGAPAAESPIVTKLDYAGSPSNGHMNVHGRLVVAASLYTTAGPSSFWVDGCLQGTAGVGGSAGTGVMVGCSQPREEPSLAPNRLPLAF